MASKSIVAPLTRSLNQLSQTIQNFKQDYKTDYSNVQKQISDVQAQLNEQQEEIDECKESEVDQDKRLTIIEYERGKHGLDK
ncbi:hypothetical protein MOO45_02920 [Bombilactobacillus folatiphilus]|uniref:Uncharacterized protein n=1 Tax=Bombilactobacillus folatiphilus TaxID=2923362 RepID=A0ABY4PAD7_9LACO|nr:hypothetical protein [Bombilactobacillus folatiphilus]UQS82616.1 hypothetical protein MOO45_02920 [Bombilactobacillus folatiphilus]